METQEVSVWDYLERENPHAQHTQALYSWGLNCERTSNPFLVFLDLIGWSVENYGGRLCVMPDKLGYTELSHLADALNEYALFPNEVTEWLNALMMCEGV